VACLLEEGLHQEDRKVGSQDSLQVVEHLRGHPWAGSLQVGGSLEGSRGTRWEDIQAGLMGQYQEEDSQDIQGRVAYRMGLLLAVEAFHQAEEGVR